MGARGPWVCCFWPSGHWSQPPKTGWVTKGTAREDATLGLQPQGLCHHRGEAHRPVWEREGLFTPLHEWATLR